jgi:hypothetical protein
VDYYGDYMETFGDSGLDPLLLPLRLAIHGTEVVADFTGAALRRRWRSTRPWR